MRHGKFFLDRTYCYPIKDTLGLEEDIFWYDMQRAPAEGVIYQGPNSMRYSHPDEGISVNDIRECLDRYDRMSEHKRVDYLTTYWYKRKKNV